MDISISINPFFIKYLFTAGIFACIWLIIASALTNDDMRDTGILFFIISVASLIASIIIFKHSGASNIVLFLFMGGIQIIAFPLFRTIGMGDMYGSAFMLSIFFQITIPLLIYLYFNPNVQLFYN